MPVDTRWVERSRAIARWCADRLTALLTATLTATPTDKLAGRFFRFTRRIRLDLACSGANPQFAARPLRWSDLDRLLELADGPAPYQISIPEPVFGGTFQIDR